MNETQMTVIAAAMKQRIVPLLWGDPGIGKSAFIEGLARKWNTPIEVIIGSIREPSDFAGLPIVTGDNDVVMAPPRWVKHLNGTLPGLNEDGGGIGFLDEITTAAPAVQAAMLRVVLDRFVGDVPLHDGVMLIAAANPPNVAADGWDLAPPLANRFMHIDVAHDRELFRQGMTAGWDTTVPDDLPLVDPTDSVRAAARAEVVAFTTRIRPELLHQMPADDVSAGRAWPSPRTWDFVSQILPRFDARHGDYEAAAMLAVTGLVGEGAGVEFITWRDRLDLPDPHDVLADPSIMDWTKDADKVFAVLASVVAVTLDAKDDALWDPAWDVLVDCAERKSGDVAATAATDLLRNKWNASLRMPAGGKVFGALLKEAGLLS